MKKNIQVAFTICSLLVILFIQSCEYSNSSNIEESVEFIQSTVPIEEAQNVTMELRNGNNVGSLYLANLSNIEPNPYITNGQKKAWCIEWDVRSIQGVQNNIKLHSTQGQAYWNKLNYLLKQLENLGQEYPDLSWKEIQIVIWSIVDYKPFNIDKIPDYTNFPSQFYRDGEYLFNVELSKELIKYVENNAISAGGEKFAIIIENEGQIVTTVSE